MAADPSPHLHCRAQPLIAVRDVRASSRWYQGVLGVQGGHGGDEYEQLLSHGRLVLQLHRWDAHGHAHIGDEHSPSRGNGVLLWFQIDAFDAAVARATAIGATVLQPVAVNPNAGHREVWLRDPDGYTLVIAGRRGDIGRPA